MRGRFGRKHRHVARVDPGARRRITVSFADQIVSSTSNFITGVAIARFSGAVEFGDYALILTVWLIAVGSFRRLISEAMILDSRDCDAEATAIAHGLSAALLLGAGAAALVGAAGAAALAAGADIGFMMLAVAACLMPLLVQDYWRGVAYQRRRPGLALINDVVFALVQIAAIAGFAAVGWRNGAQMISAWGLGATAGAVLGARWFPDRAGWRDGWRLLVRLWPQSRWLLTDFVTVFTSQQAYLVSAALLLSKVDYGGYRAAFSLMGPAFVILLAAGNFGLPEVTRRAAASDHTELRRYVVRLSLGTAGCVTAYGIALALAAQPLLRALYGPEFVRFAPLTALVALQYVILVSMLGQGLALRATGTINRLWPGRIAVLIASLCTMVPLFRWLGLAGVGWTGVATGAYESVTVYLVYRRRLRADRGGNRRGPQAGAGDTASEADDGGALMHPLDASSPGATLA